MSAGQRYFPLSDDLGLARLEDGHFIYVDPLDEAVAHHLIARGYWEQWISEALLRLIRVGDRVVEVGANFGFHTLGMANKVGPEGYVVAFEANPRLAPLVLKTLTFNGYQERAQVVSAAAADVPGELTMITSRRNAGGGALSKQADAMGPEGQLITVDAVRLDDVIEGTVDLIRIDAEGAEPLILKGAHRLLSRHDVVVVLEWDVVQMGHRTSVPAFVADLQKAGFRFWKIDHSSAFVEVDPPELESLRGFDLVLSRLPLEDRS
ncbi:FkbM family methyltransferase [Brevundimonas sp.]|uniref:FkbM family methyltransferase n=1 Tax=Brevundimonas sp. TaxID=1871086 RepID=UPI0026135D3D|nr:FkbM family methyltransferase [Brevundimonas sp.]